MPSKSIKQFNGSKNGRQMVDKMPFKEQIDNKPEYLRVVLVRV